MYQRTIQKRCSIVGIGLNSGEPIKLTIEPLEENSGIIFYREDLGISIKGSYENIVSTKQTTTIGNKKGTISYIEHLMSVIFAFGIDNLRIVVDNEEIPIMDGSAISFVMMIKEAGIKEQLKPKRFLRIKKEIEIKEKNSNKFIKLIPNKQIIFNSEINFNHPIIGKSKYKFKFSLSNYIKEIARARTFGFLKDIKYFKSLGYFKGGGLENAIVLDDKNFLNDNLRFPDEFVRHKILDSIGDMKLIGNHFIGEYTSCCSSHELNKKIIEKIFSDSNNYEIIEVNSKELEHFYIKENTFSFI